MLRLIAVAIAGAALGAAATAGAVATRVVELRPGDIAPIAMTHVFCKVQYESAVSESGGPALECGETKAGLPGSYGVGITDNAAYIGRWDRKVKGITKLVYVRIHHH